MNLKKCASIFVIFVTPLAALAEGVNDVRVGEVACIDRLGPFNIIGEVLEINNSSDKVLIRDHKGNEDWHSGEKLRNVTTCKIVGEASEWAAHKGVDIISGN